MSRYFAKVAMTYTPKNQLHKELLTIFNAKDRVIMESDSGREEFLNKLREHISLANTHNSRCKPAKLEEGNQYNESDAHLRVYIPGLVHLDIWKEATL